MTLNDLAHKNRGFYGFYICSQWAFIHTLLSRVPFALAGLSCLSSIFLFVYHGIDVAGRGSFGNNCYEHRFSKIVKRSYFLDSEILSKLFLSVVNKRHFVHDQRHFITSHSVALLFGMVVTQRLQPVVFDPPEN